MAEINHHEIPHDNPTARFHVEAPLARFSHLIPGFYTKRPEEGPDPRVIRGEDSFDGYAFSRRHGALTWHQAERLQERYDQTSVGSGWGSSPFKMPLMLRPYQQNAVCAINANVRSPKPWTACPGWPVCAFCLCSAAGLDASKTDTAWLLIDVPLIFLGFTVLLPYRRKPKTTMFGACRPTTFDLDLKALGAFSG